MKRLLVYLFLCVYQMRVYSCCNMWCVLRVAAVAGQDEPRDGAGGEADGGARGAARRHRPVERQQTGPLRSLRA